MLNIFDMMHYSVSLSVTQAASSICMTQCHRGRDIKRKYGKGDNAFEFHQGSQDMKQGQVHCMCDSLQSKVLALDRKRNNLRVVVPQTETSGFSLYRTRMPRMIILRSKAPIFRGA